MVMKRKILLTVTVAIITLSFLCVFIYFCFTYSLSDSPEEDLYIYRESPYNGIPNVVVYVENEDYTDRIGCPLTQMANFPFILAMGDVQVSIDREISDTEQGKYTFNVLTFGVQKEVKDIEYLGGDDIVVARGINWYVMIQK